LERSKRKTKIGIVVSSKMDKTCVVKVSRSYQHPFYKKIVRVSKKFKAHDGENKCGVGDKVEIMETRPISRDKRFRVVKILDKGKVSAHELPTKREKKEEQASSEASN